VHPAQGTLLLVVRDIALHEAGVETVGLEFVLAPGAGEKTTLVFVPLRLDQVDPFEGRFVEDHR
jgi:hypothetical protein